MGDVVDNFLFLKSFQMLSGDQKTDIVSLLGEKNQGPVRNCFHSVKEEWKKKLRQTNKLLLGFEKCFRGKHVQMGDRWAENELKAGLNQKWIHL